MRLRRSYPRARFCTLHIILDQGSYCVTEAVFAPDLLDWHTNFGLSQKANVCSSLYLLVLMSIILRSDGLLGKITGTVYGEQVTGRNLRMILAKLRLLCARFGLKLPALLAALSPSLACTQITHA